MGAHPFTAAQGATWLMPTTGSPVVGDDGATRHRVVTAMVVFDAINVPAASHQAAHSALEQLRLMGLATPGQRKYALRCLGPSGSGKTTLARAFAASTALGRAPVCGRPAQPVVIVQLDANCTNKRLWGLVLEAHDDPPGKGTEETYRTRAYATMQRAGTELVIFDEVQHLLRSEKVRDVTDTIKRILDDKIVPLALMGTFAAKALLTRNIQLANRMIAPCDISPLNFKVTEDRQQFGEFVSALDESIVTAQVFDEMSELGSDRVASCLLTISKGVVGVAVNLVRHAVMNAVGRGATRIEPFDLSKVTNEWAIPAGICGSNPFELLVAAAIRQPS